VSKFLSSVRVSRASWAIAALVVWSATAAPPATASPFPLHPKPPRAADFDPAAPVVSATLARDPDAGTWYRAIVTIHWTSVDPDPLAPAPSQPADTVADIEGANVVYTSAPSCGSTGLCSNGTVTVSLDRTPPAGSIGAESGSMRTNSATVRLTVPAQDASSGLQRVLLSNDGARWATLPYAAAVDWSLTDPGYGGTINQGRKRVYAKWVDAAGNTSAVLTLDLTFDQTDRLAGSDRFTTAAAISAATFGPGVDVAYIATAYDFPDALAGAAAAGTLRGPVLLVASSGPVHPATRSALLRLQPKQIVVLGGTGVVDQGVFGLLSQFAPKITRLAGSDRFTTAAAISAATFGPGVDVAYIATAYDFPDALAGAAAAGTLRGPVLLAKASRTIDPSTTGELQRLKPRKVVILGGTGVVSESVASQLAAFVSSGKGLAPLPPYFTESRAYDSLPHDADGIVLARYSWGTEYNPVTISQAAMGLYSEYLSTGSSAKRDLFFKHADWLVNHQTADGLWLYTFAFGGQPVPWWSAMAEGQAMSALVRAYRLTGDAKYSGAATKALATFRRLQTNRGVMSIDNGFNWYEEYMPPYSRHTLNGFMFALIGVWDYRLTFGDTISGSIYEQGINTLVHELHRFDTGSWSCYSFRSDGRCNLASIGYHQIHVAELHYFARLTGESSLETRAQRWEQYLKNPPAGVSSLPVTLDLLDGPR
jgi:putative cell wall-binding protein